MARSARPCPTPVTAAKLEPHDHPISSKRPTVGTGDYETLNSDNVELVDLEAEPIVEITGHGVRTEAGEYAVDDLVMATGYDAITGPLSATALTNVIRSIEHHVEWIVDCLEHLRSNDIRTFEASPEARGAWDALVVRVGGFDTYRQACTHVAGNGYEGFALVGGR